jgi:hypothetical protein
MQKSAERGTPFCKNCRKGHTFCRDLQKFKISEEIAERGTLSAERCTLSAEI